MPGAEHSDRSGLGAAFARLGDGLGKVVSQHLALAQVELRDDARALALGVARLAFFLPLVIVGYGLLCTAVALAVSRWVGSAWGFALVGGVNALVGGIGAAISAKTLSRQSWLKSTRVEVGRTGTALASVTRPGGDGVEKRLGA